MFFLHLFLSLPYFPHEDESMRSPTLSGGNVVPEESFEDQVFRAEVREAYMLASCAGRTPEDQESEDQEQEEEDY